MNINSTSINKISFKETQLFIKVSWNQNKEDLFHLKVYQNNNVWTGVLSKNSANEYREDADESEEEYLDSVKVALFNDNSGYVYDFSIKDDNHATFSWKKSYGDGETMLLHCSVPLHREVSATKDDLIDLLRKENNDLEENIKDINDKNEQLHLNLEKFKYELKKFATINNDMEKILYNRFILGLNQEKRKIYQLENTIRTMTES